MIQQNYYKPVSDSELDQASVNGIVSQLRKEHKDRFSHYFTPKDLATLQRVDRAARSMGSA